MRAICESCSQPQPPSWRAGDLCIQCGNIVRRELRCFWCAKWTPAGKFCRSCAAAVVEPERYGAARMLKQAGVDRFTVPKMLAELDQEQIENFANIYARHAAVLNRHLEHARLLERHLYQRHWSGALEDQLIGELPWEDPRFNELDVHIAVAGDGLELARAVQALSPLPVLRSVAALARIHLGDNIGNDVHELFHSPQADIRAEAALQLTTWRAFHGPGVPIDARELLRALQQSPCPGPAAAHRLLLGERGVQVPANASLDAEDEFCVAIGERNVDRLRAALRSDDFLRRHVAARILIDAGSPGGIDDVLLACNSQDQLQLLKRLSMRGKPVPDLRRTLFRIAEETTDRYVLSAAGYLLALATPPEEALAIVRLCPRDRTVYQALLQKGQLPPDILERLLAHWIETGEFDAGMWGLEENLKSGRLAHTFAPRHWNTASGEMRIELISLAEKQLEISDNAGLRRFYVQRLFEPDSDEVVIEAWKCVYRRGQAFELTVESLTTLFDSPAAFLPVLTRFLGNGHPPAILREMWIREPLAKLLYYADENLVPHWASAAKRDIEALLKAIRGLMRDESQDYRLRGDCASFLAMLAAAPTLRPAARALLKEFQGTDVDHHCGIALDRIARLEGEQ